MSSNKLCIGFNFKHEYAKMSRGGKREKFRKWGLKGATSAAFAVSVGEKFIIKKKRGDPVLKVTDDGRGQHMQRDLVPELACFPVLIVNLSIDFCFQTASNTYYRKIFPIQLDLDAFCLSAKQNRTNRDDWVRLVRLSSVIERTSLINRTHRKVPVRLCSITEPIEPQSDRLGSIEFDGFWFGFAVRSTMSVIKL